MPVSGLSGENLVDRSDPRLTAWSVGHPSHLSELSIRVTYPSQISESPIRVTYPSHLSESSPDELTVPLARGGLGPRRWPGSGPTRKGATRSSRVGRPGLRPRGDSPSESSIRVIHPIHPSESSIRVIRPGQLSVIYPVGGVGPRCAARSSRSWLPRRRRDPAP